MEHDGGPADRQPAIGDYGLLGDTRTGALVAASGSIDWLCLPRFDSEPVFGRLVGGDEAGAFALGPAGRDWEVARRRYRTGSAVLETTWQTPSAELVLTEGMLPTVAERLLPQSLLVRRIECRGEPAPVEVVFRPRRRVAGRARVVRRSGGMLVCSWGGLAVALVAPGAVPVDEPVVVTVAPGHPVTVALVVADGEPLVWVAPEEASRLLDEADAWWRRWSSRIEAPPPFGEAVVRSAITLRLLTYSPSGAPLASPTTSLPEEIGGARNWDYRYAWARDASIGVSAFLHLGHVPEATAFLSWLLHAGRLSRPELACMFTLDGGPPPDDRELEGWPGYRGSRPVRVGNSAARQHQLDAYGWVVDAAWNQFCADGPLSGELWRVVCGLADTVAARWAAPDNGIWEVRGERRHYVHSKLMAWLALDRAVRLASSHRSRPRRVARWRMARSQLGHEIRDRGFDPLRGRYRRAYTADDVDAAVLVLPAVGLEEPTSPRVRATVDAIRDELGAGGPLLYRYMPGQDGLDGREGAFLACSFWLAQALAQTGRVDEAGELLDDLVALATPLGLYAEEMDPETHEHLGNFPLALTHAGLLQAAVALAQADRWRREAGPLRAPGG